MTTYTWPEGRTFEPAAATLRVRHNQERFSESPLSGAVQTLAMPGSRWGWQLDWPGSLSVAEAAELEAMVVRLSGRQHRVRLWDFKRQRPRGNIQLQGVTVGVPASQFATSLQLAGCRGSSLVPNGSFETHATAFIADGWSVYTNGQTGVTQSAIIDSVATLGAKSQWVRAIDLGTTSSDRVGITTVVPVSVATGQVLTAAVSMLATAGVTGQVFVRAIDTNANVERAVIQASAVQTGGFVRLVASAVVPGPVNQLQVFAWVSSMPSQGEAAAYFDDFTVAAQASAASYAVATLRQGDWVQIGGQLLMVVSDAKANDAGAMTVEVRHMLRAAVPSGTAVVLDKPTGLFMLADGTTAFQRVPGQRGAALSLEFIEVFS